MTLENLIPLTPALRRLPNPPSPATAWRWCMHGVRGVKLKTWVIGSRRYTTPEALEEFIAATTAAAAGETIPAPIPHDREAAIRKAEAQLAADGI